MIPASLPRSKPVPRPRLVAKTDFRVKVMDQRFECSACKKEFAYVAPYGAGRGGSIKAMATYLKTRFEKHIWHHHIEFRDPGWPFPDGRIWT